MLEPDDWWVEQAQPLRRELPFAIEHPLDNTYGIALYSRFPLGDATVREVVEDDIPSIWGTFELPAGDRVRFAFLHPRPPEVARVAFDDLSLERSESRQQPILHRPRHAMATRRCGLRAARANA